MDAIRTGPMPLTPCICNAGEEEEEMAEDEVAAEAKGEDAAAGEVEETG